MGHIGFWSELMLLICRKKKYYQERHRSFSEAGLKHPIGMLLGHIDP
jgi:hypothetical protein